MVIGWRGYVEAMTRAHRLELMRLRDAPPNFERSLEWLSDAWEFADRYSGARDGALSREEHGLYLVRLRQRIAQGRMTP
jgi:hypothetical protein